LTVRGFRKARTAISFSPKGIPLPLKSIRSTPTACVGSQRVIKDSGKEIRHNQEGSNLNRKAVDETRKGLSGSGTALARGRKAIPEDGKADRQDGMDHIGRELRSLKEVCRIVASGWEVITSGLIAPARSVVASRAQELRPAGSELFRPRWNIRTTQPARAG
jgi:hypothetical protein